MKYLIAGLGNIGEEYKNTRHNVGFMVLDALAGASNVIFSDCRYGFTAQIKYKGRTFVLLKPSTYMNRSGNAVNYWLKKENIPLENLLVIADDIAIPTGSLRLRSKGSPGGHNGLANISEILGTEEFARLRVGIGNGYPKGGQIDYVLGKFTSEQIKIINERIPIATEIIKSFCTIGCELTMTAFNKIGKITSTDGNKDR